MRVIEKIIEEIDNLKPVSYICNRVIEITNNRDSSLSELVDVIKYDQAITANLLRICNSSYFGLKKKMASIKQAVAYLGLDKVASLIVMGIALKISKRPRMVTVLRKGSCGGIQCPQPL